VYDFERRGIATRYEGVLIITERREPSTKMTMRSATQTPNGTTPATRSFRPRGRAVFQTANVSYCLLLTNHLTQKARRWPTNKFRPLVFANDDIAPSNCQEKCQSCCMIASRCTCGCHLETLLLVSIAVSSERLDEIICIESRSFLNKSLLAGQPRFHKRSDESERFTVWTSLESRFIGISSNEIPWHLYNLLLPIPSKHTTYAFGISSYYQSSSLAH